MIQIRIKYVLLSIISLLIVFFSFESMSVHAYHAFENWFIIEFWDLLTNTSFSLFTTKTNLLAGLVSLVSLPYFLVKIINPSYKIPRPLYILRYITTTNLILVFITVAVLLTPGLSIIIGDFSTAMERMYGTSQLYTHFLIPIIFSFSFFILEDFEVIYKKERRYALIPFILYSIEFTFFVFIIKTWGLDLYGMDVITKYLGAFGVILFFIIILSVTNLASCLTCKIKTKTSSKQELIYELKQR